MFSIIRFEYVPSSVCTQVLNLSVKFQNEHTLA